MPTSCQRSSVSDDSSKGCRHRLFIIISFVLVGISCLSLFPYMLAINMLEAAGNITTKTANISVANNNTLVNRHHGHNDTIYVVASINKTNATWDDRPARTSGKERSNTKDGSEEPAAPVLTLLVMLSGEFGNNVFKIIRGWGTARLAEQEFGLATRLVFAQQRSSRQRGNGDVFYKARKATQQLKRCFVSPSFQTEDFGLGNQLVDDGYFHELDLSERDFTLSDDRATILDIKGNLTTLYEYLEKNPELIEKQNDSTIITNATGTQPIVPRLMVRVDSLVVYSIVNKFYRDIHKAFVFNENECCGKTLEFPPAEDETVLHLRNFAWELKREYKRREKGFQELSANRIASEVLGHLKEGDKVALAGRHLEMDAQQNDTEAYSIISALQIKNLTLRYSPGTEGMEDFCFLTHAKKELIGSSKSTYLELAAYMGAPSLKIARMYQLVTPENVAMYGNTMLSLFRDSVGANWSDPELISKVHFDEYF